LHSTEIAESVVSEALQIHGANGYQQGHPLEYLHRYVRGFRIAGGTDEIMKNTIGKMLRKEGFPSLV
jgi:alkylation response protein AidB-like acyl-CoA dehydrogenase